MELEVNGTRYSRFTEASAFISLDTIARSFSFTAVSTEGLPLPFKGGEACRVIVDGEPVLTGFIEVVNVEYDSSSHSITVEGRGKTGDLVDSSLLGKEFSSSISLKKIIEEVLSEIDLDIEVFDNTDIEDFNPAEDKIGREPAENAFGYIEKLARKRQVLLTSDADGNVVITRSEPTPINVNLQNIVGSDENNIISASASYDNTNRFRFYVGQAQQNTASLSFGGGEVNLLDIVGPGADIEDSNTEGGSEIQQAVEKLGETDPDVRKSRAHVYIAEKASGVDQIKLRSIWEANIRRTRSQLYSATINGYRTKEGELWSFNKLISIVDSFADINAQMLINSVAFKFGISEGRETTLGFVAKNSYQVSLDEPDSVDDVGNNLFGGAT